MGPLNMLAGQQIDGMRQGERIDERCAPLAKIGEVKNVELMLVDEQIVEHEIAVLVDAANSVE